MINISQSVDLADAPAPVRELVQQREEARAKKDFAVSDKLRQTIKEAGYLVNDKDDGLEILKIGDTDKKPVKSFLLLFGSGENAPGSVDIYRQTFLQLGKRNLKIALISTPAGFQPNVKTVYGEIKDFLITSLPDFNLDIHVIEANNRDLTNDPAIVEKIMGTDVIFMGPGSPTYAVKHLLGTKLLTAIIGLMKNGSTLILASAATIACSKFALPVYEIYKVGEDLHWVDGLNLYKEIWSECTVIPHFNNREGGKDLDTSYCFVGQGRAEKMLAMLPEAENILGIDEHTALIIDLKTGEQSVRGKGGIHKVK